MTIDWRGLAVALGAGVSGAAIALWFGLPAAALLGSAVAVTAVALLRLQPSVPAPLRDLAFCVIGVTLGAGVSPDILSDIARWPISILMLAVTVFCVLGASAVFLRIVYRPDPATAMLATSPGALSYTLALATEYGADVRFVMVMQSMRLLLITVFLPPLIGLSGPVAVAGSGNLAVLGYFVGAVLLVLSYAAGWALTRLRVPAPYLLSSLIVSSAAHGLGLVEGRLHDTVTLAGFIMIGAVIGGRFAGIRLAELRRLALAGAGSTVIAVLVALAGAMLVSRLLDLPFGQVWVSFAPGGVEGMSSIALALGYDPVYVATHHVVRILLLIAALPILLTLFGSKPTGPR